LKYPSLLLAPISLAALLSSACAGLEPESMVPGQLQVGDPHHGSVHVDALGSKPVGGQALAQAVATSLATTHMFDSVVESAEEDSDWVLTVTVTDLERDSPGLTMSTKTTIDWSLRAASATKSVWSQTIVTGYTATPDDTPFVEDRGRLATGHAVRENIRRALVALGELELD